MKISVSIDSNAWNFLFKNNINLARELPPEEFNIYITREVEIENEAIPDIGVDGEDKLPLKQYIKDSLASNLIKTTVTFGFAEGNPANGPATFGGFDQGTFQTDIERSWYQQEIVKNLTKNKPLKKSGLHANQADAAVAAKSFDSIVLTCDSKKGPIREADKQGGKIIFLSTDLLSKQSLAELVRSKYPD